MYFIEFTATVNAFGNGNLLEVATGVMDAGTRFRREDRTAVPSSKVRLVSERNGVVETEKKHVAAVGVVVFCYNFSACNRIVSASRIAVTLILLIEEVGDKFKASDLEVRILCNKIGNHFISILAVVCREDVRSAVLACVVDERAAAHEGEGLIG